MSWLKNVFTGTQSSTSTSTTSTAAGGTYAGVGQTTPSTLPYTSPTYHTGTTVTNGGYVSGPIGVASPSLTTGIYNPNSTFTTINTGGMPQYGTIHISGANPSIATDKVKIDLNELGELISVMKERLLIITPNFEKHEKYAALKKAYDNYKLIEAMVSGDENDNK